MNSVTGLSCQHLTNWTVGQCKAALHSMYRKEGDECKKRLQLDGVIIYEAPLQTYTFYYDAGVYFNTIQCCELSWLP